MTDFVFPGGKDRGGWSVIVQAPKTGVITRIGWVGAVSNNPALDVRLEDLSDQEP